MDRDRDSDDDFETGLPKVPIHQCTVEPVNVRDLMEGKAVTFKFEVPEMVRTEGYQKHRDPPVEKMLNRATFEQMQLNFLASQALPEALKTMFGDFSDIEPFMDPVTEDGKMKKRLLRPGTGKKVNDRDIVVVDFMVGTELMDDVIESSYGSNRRKRFRVGAGEVLSVMDIGVSTMRVGEIAKFLATSEFGYGKLGVPLMDGRVVPADVRVMIQLEVLDCYISEKNENISQMSPMERRELPFEELFAYTETMKNDGNREYLENEYERAIPFYLEALEAIKDMEPATTDQRTKYFKIRVHVCNNIVQAYLKLNKVKRAMKYSEDATKIPINGHLKAKSLFWFSKCLFELGKFELCLENIKKADQLYHNNDIRDLKRQVEEKVKENMEKEKELCSRMMAADITDKKE